MGFRGLGFRLWECRGLGFRVLVERWFGGLRFRVGVLRLYPTAASLKNTCLHSPPIQMSYIGLFGGLGQGFSTLNP